MATYPEFVEKVTALRARVQAKDVRFPVDSFRTIFRCRTCGTDAYWGKSARKRLILIDCDVPGGTRPDAATARPGMGCAHHATCPQGKEWSMRRREASARS